ncbi:hypothetical protein K2V74_10275 [Mammaliicoccus sciuri]|uniref:hypothetical protein n=1 Tax=Mammaliicoccus sciuri TaxID=1296 RepID=UPI001E338A7C|nr:hypothetical protein [Mammaliicoccus sciuri]MCD8874706.1 hypothetical protein [Mammaliicoccus sciuri]
MKLPSMRGDFDAERQTYGQNENFFIGINNEEKLIKIGMNTSKHFRTADSYRHYKILTRTFNYKEIVSVEIIEDDVTVTKSNRASQLVGAGIGSALLGGTGAIIGGLSGKKTGTTEIKNITLRIVVNDEVNSVFDLPFLEKKYPIKRTANEYKYAINSIYSWHSVLTKIIENEDQLKDIEIKQNTTIQLEDKQEKLKTDKSKNASNNVINDSNSTSIIDQLERIVSMKENGLIDDIEFSKLKNKIIK